MAECALTLFQVLSTGFVEGNVHAVIGLGILNAGSELWFVLNGLSCSRQGDGHLEGNPDTEW